ncbi:hypothetical protein F8M41_023814 [Gigaspora margarita]|uniref:Uncharacterized protein n=1 Tax=Gigaspora margarita TaxID=4874 RepID=A0A8H4ACQ4_GIGMA|nr:hypothetical protein F8M41_023814 [Gigaspora margarita]
MLTEYDSSNHFLEDSNDFDDNNNNDFASSLTNSINKFEESIDSHLPPPDISTTTVTPLPDTATIMSLSQTPRHKLCKRKCVQANNLGVNHNDIANESTAASSNNDFEENTESQSPPDIATTMVVTMSSSSQTQRYNLRKRKRVNSSSSSQAQTYNF